MIKAPSSRDVIISTQASATIMSNFRIRFCYLNSSVPNCPCLFAKLARRSPDLFFIHVCTVPCMPYVTRSCCKCYSLVFLHIFCQIKSKLFSNHSASLASPQNMNLQKDIIFSLETRQDIIKWSVFWCLPARLPNVALRLVQIVQIAQVLITKIDNWENILEMERNPIIFNVPFCRIEKQNTRFPRTKYVLSKVLKHYNSGGKICTLPLTDYTVQQVLRFQAF